MAASLSKDPKVDLLVENHGSIFLLRAETPAGGDFLLEADSEAQYFGGALAVEHRYIRDVVDLAREKGLVVR